MATIADCATASATTRALQKPLLQFRINELAPLQALNLVAEISLAENGSVGLYLDFAVRHHGGSHGDRDELIAAHTIVAEIHPAGDALNGLIWRVRSPQLKFQ